ncbi:MAG TPA: hypothetical protein DEP91_09385 [Sphingomonas bacterium]|uniref:Photolyase/cryptochrome alpha/beta domain-containing protein n=1 Tax=Sphingomonas bacterium TaxID=1895847 RepID=A0A3D0WCL6_9SPHN|nr:hypothetical protein [Sphingomonas bacterium]
MSDPVILWFRRDLRLADQPALAAACRDGPVIPVYILDDDAPKHHAMGGASRWWLHHSLESLAADIKNKGSRLILRRGKSAEVLAKLAKETGAARVHCIRHWEPWWRNAERAVAKELELCCHDGNYLARPGSITTGAGKPFRIYTPFWRALKQHMPPADPLQRPRDIPHDVLSQLGTLFVHRLTNKQDRDTVESACGDLDRGAAQFIPMLGPGEAIIIGPDLPAPLPVFIHPPTSPPDSRGPSYQSFWRARREGDVRVAQLGDEPIIAEP